MNKKNNRVLDVRLKVSWIKILIGFISAFLTISLPLLGHAIFTNHHESQKKFTILNEYFRNTTYDAEHLNDACDNTSKDKSEKIYEQVKILRNDLGKLINQNAAMGHLISLKSYCLIHSFTKQYDQVQENSHLACQAYRMTTFKLNSFRENKYLPKIDEDARSRQNFIASLQEYFLPLTTYTYVPEDCLALKDN